MGDINWISIIISTLIPTVIGFIWYHKALFGTAWMNSIGLTDEKMKEANMGVIFGVSILMSLILSFFLLGFNNGPGQEGEFDSFGHGAFHGAFLGLFVAAPLFIANGLFSQKKWKTMLIDIGYWTATLAVMGGVVDAMNHWPNAM